MRTLALAEEISRRGGEVTFVSRQHDGNLIREIVGRGFRVIELPAARYVTTDRWSWLGSEPVEDAVATRTALASVGAVDWLVVDHYAIDAGWERHLQSAVGRILVIDDLADRTHVCDALTDPLPGNPESQRARYCKLVDGCELLLGPQYALLRREFVEASRLIGEGRRYGTTGPLTVHLYFGSVGDKPWLRYGRALLDSWARLRLIIVAPDADDADIRSLGSAYMGRATVLRHTPNMAATLAECDVAFGAPGTTTWERACMGLPAAYVATSPVQADLLPKLEESGFCTFLGALSSPIEAILIRFGEFISDWQLLAAQSRAGRQRVDGMGASRVVNLFWE